MDQEQLKQAQVIVGYTFQDLSLLDKALTHSSVCGDPSANNERMEFLGDAVLGLVVCQRLFERFGSYREGDLTKIKSRLVSRKVCAQLANQLGIMPFLKVGKGTDVARALNGSIAAGCFEALVAAIYLDGGFEPAKAFILRLFEPLINQTSAEAHQDNFKSLLQQYCQKEFGKTPHYELLDEKGPDHNKCFEVGVIVDGRRFPSAWGVTKKDAEQLAARNALIELKAIPAENAIPEMTE